MPRPALAGAKGCPQPTTLGLSANHCAPALTSNQDQDTFHPAMTTIRVYLSPGMFGFARLAAYDYFEHVQQALEQRFHAAGQRVAVRVADVHPTASIRRRAAKLADLVTGTAGSDDGPIHLVGHSTGGLDARLVASPTAHLTLSGGPSEPWRERIRSVTTINTPHFGTPLATFFATAKGQRLLYALSAITVTALKLGAPPLAAASALVATLGRTNDLLDIEETLVGRVTQALHRALDEAADEELQQWLDRVKHDQGSIVQLMPEAMDLFQAGVEDRPGVYYQFVASYVPSGELSHWLSVLRSPWSAASAALFHLMSNVTRVQDQRYPCQPEQGVDAIFASLDQPPPPGANDGVVPLCSQFWGKPAWIGRGDHLDVVGHFPGPGGHNDWLASGAQFNLRHFERIMDGVYAGMRSAQLTPQGSAPPHD